MPRPRAWLAALLVIALGACGGPPASGQPGSAPTGASGPTGEGIQTVVDGLASLVIPPGEGTDLLVDRLTTALDLHGALGEQADAILALMAAAERAAYAGLPDVVVPPTALTDSAAAPRIVTAGYLAAVPTPPKAPPPTTDLMNNFPGSLDAVGREGSGSTHRGPTSASATERGDGLTASSTMTTTIDIKITGSAVELKIERSVRSTVVVDAGGATALDATEKYIVTGRMDVCPTGAGLSVAGLDQSITFDATTKPGALGRVGTKSVGNIKSASTFRGQVDDAAKLGNVTQDYSYEEQWKRTAAAEGGPEARREGSIKVSYSGIGAGVPSAHGFDPSLGEFSTVDGNVETSGDVTQQMVNSTAISAAWDFATIDQAYVAAQTLWRNSRCVVVAVPQYDVPDDPVESEIAVNLQGSEDHLEDVDKGSATPFEAVLRHRFGQSVGATIEATLSGQQKLEPSSIAGPSGTLTYTAPNETGKAGVRMSSTSKQGIGILAIAFETEPAKGLVGMINVVEEWGAPGSFRKRSLTVHVRLVPRAGFDGVTGWFDDNGSSYAYSGSGLTHTASGSDDSCYIDQGWTSAGSGSFEGSGRSIAVLIDQAPGRAALSFEVQFATNYTVTTACFGEQQTSQSSDDRDGWAPICGATLSDLEGRVAADGTINFSCTAPIQPGTGSITVGGSLTRR